VSYYKDVSFMRDLSIIFQTLKVVVARNGY